MTYNGEQHDSRQHHPQVVVRPVVAGPSPYRAVEVLGFPVGQAHSYDELAEICQRVGLVDLPLEQPGSVEWIGGDASCWR